MPPVVVAYISAHGFGHWAQMAPVLQALATRHPELRLILRTALPDSLLSTWLAHPFTHRAGEIDIGVIQRNALEEDLDTTRQAVLAFHRHWPERVRDEAAWLRDTQATLVISDIAPLAFAAARRAGMPAVGLCSLDWHDIYRPLFGSDFPPLDDIRQAHESCTLLLQPPLCMPMQSFPQRRSIGLIAHRSRLNRDGARRAMQLVGDAKIALVAFGGMARPPFEMQRLAAIDGWQFLLPGEADPGLRLPANVRSISTREHSIPDLLTAADCLVCKPGYGMLAEAWAAQCPIAWVPRPHFPEYAYLRQWLETQAPALCLDRDTFRQGSWQATLDRLITLDRAYPPLPPDGAPEAAEQISLLL
jgi:hypothetical protein